MRHVAGLDGLRAIAVLAVVAFHAGPASWLVGGYLGVDVFFVLSGFLITAILADEHGRSGRIGLGQFYLRRFLRLMPALALLVVAYLAVAPIVWPEYGRSAHVRDGLLSLGYLSDYAYAFWRVPEYLRHTWSLAVEEHFYLLWPLVLPFVLRLRKPANWLLAAYGLAAIWRLANLALLEWELAYYRFDTRMAGLLLGCWLAVWLIERGRSGLPIRSPIGPSLAMLTLVAAFVAAPWMDVTGASVAIPVVEIATACLILALVSEPGASPHPVLRALETPWMQQIGILSYGIYLWHFPIALVIRDIMPYWQSLLVCVVFGTLLAWLSYHSVEAFGRRLRQRYEARPLRAKASCGLQSVG